MNKFEKEEDLQFRLASVLGIMAKIARFAEVKSESRESDALDIGYGGYTLSRYLKDGIKDILTLEAMYNSEKRSLEYKTEECQEQLELIRTLFGGDFQAYEISELLNDDEKKVIKDIFTGAVIRDREELEKIAREEDKK